MKQRLAAANHFRREIASVNIGSLTFRISGTAKRDGFVHDWEQPCLEMTKDFILSNTFAKLEHPVPELSGQGTRSEFECYDVGHLYNLAHFAERGMVKPLFFVQSIFGILDGIGP